MFFAGEVLSSDEDSEETREQDNFKEMYVGKYTMGLTVHMECPCSLVVERLCSCWEK